MVPDGCKPLFVLGNSSQGIKVALWPRNKGRSKPIAAGFTQRGQQAGEWGRRSFLVVAPEDGALREQGRPHGC